MCFCFVFYESIPSPISCAPFTLFFTCLILFSFYFQLINHHHQHDHALPPSYPNSHCKIKTMQQRTNLPSHPLHQKINPSNTSLSALGHPRMCRKSSKRISNAMHDITSTAGSNNNSNSVSYRQSLGPGTVQSSYNSTSGGGGTPRRSWSSYAFNNKNFPDGKLSYESTQNQPPQQTSGASASSALYSVYSSNASGSNSSGKQSAANAGSAGTSGKLSSSLAARSRFERSSQDVMARASQIVM